MVNSDKAWSDEITLTDNRILVRIGIPPPELAELGRGLVLLEFDVGDAEDLPLRVRPESESGVSLRVLSFSVEVSHQDTSL